MGVKTQVVSIDAKTPLTVVKENGCAVARRTKKYRVDPSRLKRSLKFPGALATKSGRGRDIVPRLRCGRNRCDLKQGGRRGATVVSEAQITKATGGGLSLQAQTAKNALGRYK